MLYQLNCFHKVLLVRSDFNKPKCLNSVFSYQKNNSLTFINIFIYQNSMLLSIWLKCVWNGICLCYCIWYWPKATGIIKSLRKEVNKQNLEWTNKVPWTKQIQTFWEKRKWENNSEFKKNDSIKEVLFHDCELKYHTRLGL